VSETGSAVSETEAIEIARARVEDDDPSIDMAERRAVVIEDGDVYDVAFPRIAPPGPGGEPHVLVDRRTGEVVDTYRTR
jgi:Zn-dependent metalloprotease